MIKKKELQRELTRLTERVWVLERKPEQLDYLKLINRLESIINLLLDHLKLEVKDEDYVGIVVAHKGNSLYPGSFYNEIKKLIKTRQVLVPKNDQVAGKFWSNPDELGQDDLKNMLKRKSPITKIKRKK